ncbi:MAG: hypothetical protein JWL65_7152 [Gammaproteobacteria bacterium]|nr:hypothetical protein [Gammaproteobacteria bacterium]
MRTLLQQLLGRLTQPRLAFASIAALVLAILWLFTLNLTRSERAQSEHAAYASTLEQLGTYEAQVVRVLRDIDRTLKLVQYASRSRGVVEGFNELNAQDLLPRPLLFSVSVTDRTGTRVASSGSMGAQIPLAEHFERVRANSAQADDAVVVDRPRSDPASGEWLLRFSRPLLDGQGSFVGIVTLTVQASYFVSSYDAAVLGEHGVLGLLGTDGVFRVRRTGTSIMSGEVVDYAAATTGATDEDAKVTLVINPWDHVQRYTAARELFGLPLSIIVGISEQDQLAEVLRHQRIYRLRAAGASAFTILLALLLGRLSAELAESRRAAQESRIAHAEQMEHLAFHDGLTGLPNRSLFSKLLSQSIHEARRYERRMAVALLDLDRFKQINDTLGHDAGDDLLKEVAARLKACVRESDTVARLGGDEFVVLMPDLADESHAANVAQKILSATAQPFTLIGQEFRVTASIGISTYPHDGLDEQSLKKHADVAMYHAKAEGKNNFQFYSEKLNANSLERLTLESSIRRALEQQEFLLHYQAKRDITTGRVTGMEALLRWQHPELGMISPMQFIPTAEETGLIIPIGKWVLNSVCRQSIEWQQQGLPPLAIAVNLTSTQFCDENLVADVSSILVSTGMDPQLLEIELNESLLIQDVENTLRILTQLKGLGVRIAVDDFGTGYSSLAMLQRFPLDTIKIDRCITRDLVSTPKESGLAGAIIAMGKSLSLTVVGQGVETREQAEFLRVHACDELQGFYFKRPLPADEFAQLLRAQTTEVTYIGARRGVSETS